MTTILHHFDPVLGGIFTGLVRSGARPADTLPDVCGTLAPDPAVRTARAVAVASFAADTAITALWLAGRCDRARALTCALPITTMHTASLARSRCASIIRVLATEMAREQVVAGCERPADVTLDRFDLNAVAACLTMRSLIDELFASAPKPHHVAVPLYLRVVETTTVAVAVDPEGTARSVELLERLTAPPRGMVTVRTLFVWMVVFAVLGLVVGALA